MPCSPASPLSARPSPSFYKPLHSFILQRQRVTRSRCSATFSAGPASWIRLRDHQWTLHAPVSPTLPRVETLMQHHRNQLKAMTRSDLRLQRRDLCPQRRPQPLTGSTTCILHHHPCSFYWLLPSICFSSAQLKWNSVFCM